MIVHILYNIQETISLRLSCQIQVGDEKKK